MKAIELGAGKPFSLKIAADPRLGPTDYAHDAIYAVSAGAGPLGLFSSFGGRATGAMLDLLWQRAPLELAYAIEEYQAAPLLERFGPSYARLRATPLPDLQAQIEFAALSSAIALCRLTLHSDTPAQIELTCGLRVHLMPEPHGLAGEPASLLRIGRQVRGAWNSVPREQLHLALLWDRDLGFESEALPAGSGWTVWQRRQLMLEPGNPAQLWVALLAPREPDEFESLAQDLIRSDLDAVLARHAALAEDFPEVETGDPDWDAAIACSYRLAARCYVGPTAALPHASFVFTRIPERGYSPAGDGSDHGWQWNGQVATEAYLNCPAVAAFAPELAMGVIRNYLAIQQPDGAIDWKPGLAGQREGLECIPLLAAICRLIWEYSADDAFLHEVYPGLLRHLEHWLSKAHDQDGDGLPEWTSTIQSAFDDNPSFVTWQSWGQGADIRKAECPDLGAYLYREARDLAWMAERIGADATHPQQIAAQLRQQVESLWDAGSQIYRYRDRDSHLTHAGGLISQRGHAEQHGAWSGTQPRRIVVHVAGPEASQIEVALQGRDAQGQALSETLTRAEFSWWGRNFSCATSSGLYQSLEGLGVSNLGPQHRIRISWVDYTREDQTLLLPLWAGIPDPARAAQLLQTISDPARFWRPYGIPNCSAQDPAYNSANRDGSGGTWMIWNSMLGEGLCEYGFFAAGWELFERIMRAIVGRLSEEQSFREAYDNDSAAGIGAADYLWGSVPLHFLSRLLGVQIRRDASVLLRPADLGARSIRVRQYGIEVQRTARSATIRWPDGRLQTVTPEQALLLQAGNSSLLE